jgi:hypothetical protein
MARGRLDGFAFRFRNGVTIGGNSILGAGVLYVLNCAGFRNITLHWLHAKNSVS